MFHKGILLDNQEVGNASQDGDRIVQSLIGALAEEIVDISYSKLD